MAYDLRLADAVATAGLEAAARDRRRVVLLVLGDASDDRSSLLPGQVRRYLERLRVPLVVWSVCEEPTEGVAAWGEVRDVSSFRKFQEAAGDLVAELDKQWMVWVAGQHLLSTVDLAPSASQAVEWP